MKNAGRVVAVIAAIALLALAAIGFVLWRSVPPLGGTERLDGLAADVVVTWDSLAVPHITAGSDSDAMMALGYLHARDRLWGMELLRRAAEGRLSEVLGGSTVSSDRYLRSLDIRRAAEAALASQDAPESRLLLDAYVRGVNQWIATRPRPLPVEFQILRFSPEPWTARQVVAIGKLQAWDLAASGTELELARAQARVGPERVRTLFPVWDDSGVTIIRPGTGTWRARTGRGAGGRTRERTEARAPSARLAAHEIPVVPELAQQVLEWAAMSNASNSWVIGGARTRSGKPILANDPHLTLRAPSLWYLAAIESPGFRVAGVTLPGVPGVVIGRNERIAWGLTNIELDDVDYVIERVSTDTTQVLTVDGWRPIEIEHDTIRVKGGAAVPFTMRRTGHGPLVAAAVPGPDSGSASERRVLAMRWNAHDPSDALTAILRVDRAGNWDEFLAAVSGFKTPEQNWIYADVDGNIGYTASGAVPVRRGGVGLLPTAGWTDEGLWERYLDFEELPRVFNPPDGFIATANNRVVGPEYPHLLSNEYAPPYRARRIRELILAGHDLTADDVRRTQMDTLDLFARATRDIAARAAAAAGRADLGRMLEAWDGSAGADRVEPTLFYTWYRAMLRATFDDELGGTWRPGAPLHAGLLTGASPWFDNVTTPSIEDRDAIALAAMREAIPLADSAPWGQVHHTISRHAMGTVGPLNQVLRLNVGPLSRPGSAWTVDVAGFSEPRPPFTNTSGSSFRHVVDLAAPDDGALILTSGQSGSPLSRHYRDQAARWLRGELWRVPLHGARQVAIDTLRLTAH